MVVNKTHNPTQFNYISYEGFLTAGIDVREKLANEAVNEIFMWMATNTFVNNFRGSDGKIEIASLAKHAICQCPLIDAEDESLWEAESGDVWDAAYVYSEWVRLADEVEAA